MRGRPTSIGGQVVDEYLKRFPTLPTLTLAKKIYKENNECYSSVENVRSILRSRKGQNGDQTRKNMKDKSKYTKPSEHWNKYNLPSSEAEPYEHFIFPQASNNILVLSDIHVPFHDVEALTVAIDYGLKENVNTILLNGDTFDFYGVSSYEKDPRKRNFQQEVEDCKEFMNRLRAIFPKQNIYVKWGNHEARWEKFLKIKAPELFDMNEFRLSTIFEFGKLGFHEISEDRIMKAGNLTIMHGHELKGGGAYPSRTLLTKTGTSAIIGHHHRTGEYSTKDIDGNFTTCWSTGCLSEMRPGFAVINQWNLGFAHVKFEKSGTFTVKNMRINDGRIG